MRVRYVCAVYDAPLPGYKMICVYSADEVNMEKERLRQLARRFALNTHLADPRCLTDAWLDQAYAEIDGE
jgi:hypothetical protein